MIAEAEKYIQRTALQERWGVGRWTARDWCAVAEARDEGAPGKLHPRWPTKTCCLYPLSEILALEASWATTQAKAEGIGACHDV